MTCFLALLLLRSSGVGPRPIFGSEDPQVDRSHWVQDMVTLYYFPNAMVLAKTLNPEGDLTTTGTSPAALAARSENDPKPLAEALGDHIDALNAFERLKQAVKDAEARLVVAT